MSNTVFGDEPSALDHGASAAGVGAVPLVLALDTATESSCVALARNGEIVAQRQGSLREARSAGLLTEIDETLREAGVSLRDVGLFAVANGPGSFTGLRAGLATVKAFAAIHRTPIAAVPTLHAVAASAGTGPRTVAAIPAGRGEVYAQLLAVGEDLRVEELSGPLHVRPATLFERAAGWGPRLRWAGEWARMHAGAIREAAESALAQSAGVPTGVADDGRDKFEWTVAEPVMSYAETLIRLGLISYVEGRTIGAPELRALYVRPSDAELNEGS